MHHSPTYITALGEYTLHTQTARHSAHRRHALLHNLAQELQRAAQDPAHALDTERLQAELGLAHEADTHMAQAIAQANTAAERCGQRQVSASTLLQRD